jgi:hypothetical protein
MNPADLHGDIEKAPVNDLMMINIRYKIANKKRLNRAEREHVENLVLCRLYDERKSAERIKQILIRQKYINEDGSLTEHGKMNMELNQK